MKRRQKYRTKKKERKREHEPKTHCDCSNSHHYHFIDTWILYFIYLFIELIYVSIYLQFWKSFDGNSCEICDKLQCVLYTTPSPMRWNSSVHNMHYPKQQIQKSPFMAAPLNYIDLSMENEGATITNQIQ